MSYRKKHVKNKIGKIRPKKSIFKKIWFWVLSLLLIVIAIAAYFVVFYSGLQVSNIIISGNNKVNTSELHKFVADNSVINLIKFGPINLSSKSILLVGEKSLKQKILSNFLAIENADIKKTFPQTIMVNVSERKPIGAYCANSGQCFYIDYNGVVFEPLSEITTGTTVIRQASDSGQISEGKQAMAKNLVGDIYKIQKILKDNFQIDLKEAMLTSPIRLNVVTQENWKIYFQIEENSNIDSQLTKLNLLLQEGISDSSRKNLRYIDLRPEDRAIVCDNDTCGS